MDPPQSYAWANRPASQPIYYWILPGIEPVLRFPD